MITTLRTYASRGRSRLKSWVLEPRTQGILRGAFFAVAGFLLAAASLGNRPMPIAMALVLSGPGWTGFLAGAGAFLGYRVFWGEAAAQCLAWVVAALPAAALAGSGRVKLHPWLLPAVGTLIVSVSGVLFQALFYDNTPIPLYLLRVGLAGGTSLLFSSLTRGRNALLEWLGCCVGVLALAQLAPAPWLNLGFLAAGFLTAAGAFPAAALAGLGLDLAQVSRVPMAAALSLSYLPRFFPGYPKWAVTVGPAFVYTVMMGLAGVWEPLPAVSLVLGGLLGAWLPLPGRAGYRRGETGVAQVRLELAAGVMAQTQQLLSREQEYPIDEEGLVSRAAQQACSGCPCRKYCPDSQALSRLPGNILHKTLTGPEELPIICRKSGRFLAQLHMAQEQLRSIHADRQRQGEYRAAVMQQYGFLAQYLRELSDGLSRRAQPVGRSFVPELTVAGNRPEWGNGDRCIGFAGVGGRYYILMCDGMGTGSGAIREGKNAQQLLQSLLSAGYPAEHALRSLNSLCALRERAGAVTVDLVEVILDTGRATLYKWGAAPSYLVAGATTVKLGITGPPPGLSMQERERTEKASLRRGEWLVLVSDGIGEEAALALCRRAQSLSPRELAEQILALGQLGGQDDATVAILRLKDPA